MKKKFFPVALMALAIGFNACSSDDVTVNANGGALDGNVAVLEGGYVKMAINMPSEPSSRASNSNNDNFEDGLPKEFEVKDATLILFAGDGANEDKAIFHSAYNLDKISLAKEGAQITSTMRIVQPVDSMAYVDKNKLYAYVLLNNNGLVTFDGKSSTEPTLKLKKATGTEGSETLSDVTKMDEKTTFGNFRKYIAEGGESVFHANGFLMNNAPLSNKPGGKTSPSVNGQQVSSLVEIGGSVYKTKAQADSADAKEVFVERALAKVTLKAELKKDTLSASDFVIKSNSTTLNKKFSVEAWNLDVTNKTSYLGRSYSNAWSSFVTANLAGENEYRFVGSKPLRKKPATVGEGLQLYRTYWGEDPNYFSSKKEDFNRITKAAAATTDLINKPYGTYNPLYCMENTLDVVQMENGSQVTRAVVKVKFLDGTTFYTFNDDNTTLYTQEKMIERVKQAILDNTVVFNKCEKEFTANKISINKDDVTITWTSQVANPEGSATYDPKRDEEGKIYLKSFKIAKGGKKVESSDVFAADADLNKELQLGNLLQYVNGLAYYSIPIKHFGNDLTPWSATTTGVYPGSHYENNKADKYLGRYGVLRNNWYDITVSAIRNIGSPVVPEINFNDKNTPDEVNNYIAVRINVLSWAKRTQVEEL